MKHQQRQSFAGRIPNPEQLMRLASNRPSGLDLALCNGDWTPCRSKIEIARRMGCSIAQINKAIAAISAGRAHDTTLWRPQGRPIRIVDFTPECLQWILARETLRQQVGFSLEQRAAAANL